MSPTQPTPHGESAGRQSSALGTALKIAAGLVAIVALWLLARRAGGYVPRFAEWVDGLGIWGPVVFVLGYALATVVLIPGSLLTLAAGAIFGLLEGVTFVFLGATLGAVLAFLVARYLARGAVERRLAGNEKFRRIDRAVGRQGLKITFLLRLSPAFPFVLLNYGLGLTRVKLWHYALASLGMLPATVLYVYYGKVIGDVAALAGGAAPERGTLHYVLLGVGLAATAVVAWVVGRIAKRALAEEENDV